MKRAMRRLICTATALLAFGFISVAQTYSEVEVTDEENNTLIQEITPQVFAALGIDNSTNPENANLQGNSVFIRQVGEFNRTDIKIASNASNINLGQNGDDNLISLEYTVNTAIATLRQNGNGHIIRDFVLDQNADVSLDLEQTGNGFYFERYGSNSITESLKFKQTEASPVIIIRSFN